MLIVVAPMHPTLVRAPFHRLGWVYERKEDGWRMLAYKDGGAVRLVSRRGVDHTARFADIAAAVASQANRRAALVIAAIYTRTITLGGAAILFFVACSISMMPARQSTENSSKLKLMQVGHDEHGLR